MDILKLIKNDKDQSPTYFLNSIQQLNTKDTWTRGILISLFEKVVPEFKHKEPGIILESKM